MQESEDVEVRAERVVHDHFEDVAQPRGDECLMCYLQRVVEAFGCDTTLRWSQRWIRHQRNVRRRVGGLSRELRRRGGFCDCEVLMNVYGDRVPNTPDPRPCSHGGLGW